MSTTVKSEHPPLAEPTAGLPPDGQAWVTQLCRANALLRQGQPREAEKLYRQLTEDHGLPGEMIEFNLDMAHRRSRLEGRGGPGRDGSADGRGSDDAFRFAERSFAAFSARHTAPPVEKYPKVTVAVTCFNAQDTIQESIESLLHQTYPNLEVVACDDHSTDGTWQVLTDLAERCSGLKILRNNSNYGTYLSKNRAIDIAEGEIVMFQDSDDISHPARVQVQVAPLLADAALMATRTKYLRYDETTSRIIEVGGQASKFGLITLAVRRRAFAEIGFFDAVRRAGDDEWVQRLTHLYGTVAMRNLDVTLYLARLRANSLVADMIKVAADGSGVDQSSSPPRRAYVQQFRERFAANPEAKYFRDAFPPFPVRANTAYPDSIGALGAVSAKVYASLCSIPSRLETLRRTIRSLEPQIDGIFLYLDKYDDIPQDLRDNAKLTIFRSQDHAVDYRDNGKFLAYNDLLARADPFYYFCCDDDIVYPHDYVHTMVREVDKFGRRVAVGVHGVIVEEKPRAYFRRRFNYHFSENALASSRLVSNLGTGTLVFHSSLFDRIDPADWPRGGMVDIYFSIECKRRLVPMLCIGRHSGWLFEIDQAKSTPSLFQEFNDKEELITRELRAVAPWGFRGIEEAVRAQPPAVRQKLHACLPPFHTAISVTACFPRLR